MNIICNRKILTFPFDPSSSMKAMFSFWVSWLTLCIAPFSTSKNRKRKRLVFFYRGDKMILLRGFQKNLAAKYFQYKI